MISSKNDITPSNNKHTITLSLSTSALNTFVVLSLILADKRRHGSRGRKLRNMKYSSNANPTLVRSKKEKTVGNSKSPFTFFEWW